MASRSNKDLLSDFKRGWVLLKDSLIIFKNFPIIGFPIFFLSVIEGAGVIYFEYYFDFTPYSWSELLLISFLIVAASSFAMAFACSILVELIKHIETGGVPSFTRAAVSSVHNMYRLGFVIFIWAVIDFLLLLIEVVIQAIFSRDNDESDAKREANLKNIASTLSGHGKPLNWYQYGIYLIRKKLRMVVFLTIPVVSWDKLSGVGAIKKSFTVITTDFRRFFTGFLLTEAAAIVIFLIPAIVFEVEEKSSFVEFSDPVWTVLIIYCVIGASVYYYLEQMFCAEFYLWHRYPRVNPWFYVATPRFAHYNSSRN